MDRIVGIDISLTSTGLAVITRRTDGTTLATTATFTSRGHRNDGLTERASRITTLAADIDRAAGPCVLALVEGPMIAVKGGSPVDRHHLWWAVVEHLLARGVPVAVVISTTLKRAIAGKGNADKGAVASAVTRLWADVELANADEGDALGLAHLGAVALGWPVQTLERHRESLSVIRWPAGLTVGESVA